jgi:steroid delta-isomerase-like uncharacterized protein
MFKVYSFSGWTILLIVFLLNGCSENVDEKLKTNKNLVHRFVEILNEQQLDKLSEIVIEDFKRYSQATIGVEVSSLAEFTYLQKSFLSTFPDQKVTIEKLIAEGDYIAVYATYTGTQTGQMGQFPPSDKKMEMKFFSIFRIEEGKIAEMWVEWDKLNSLMQLGHYPPESK